MNRVIITGTDRLIDLECAQETWRSAGRWDVYRRLRQTLRLMPGEMWLLQTHPFFLNEESAYELISDSEAASWLQRNEYDLPRLLTMS